MLRSCEYLNQQSTAYATNCQRRPFLCTVIQLIFFSFRGAPEFLGVYHMLFSLSLKLFYVDSFITVQVKHKRTCYKFLLQK